MSDDVSVFFKYDSVEDAIIGGLLNGTLRIDKRWAPKGSKTNVYFVLSDDAGIIKIFDNENEMTALIIKYQDEVRENFDFLGQVNPGDNYDGDNNDSGESTAPRQRGN